MHLNFELFKKHPYITGGGLLAVFVVVLLLRKGGGSASGSGGSSGTNQYDAQIAALNAAQGQQELQANAALQAASIQAGVQTQAIAASQDVTNNQTAAQLSAIEAQVAAQTQSIQVQGQTQVSLAQIQEQGTEAGYQYQAQQKQAVLDYLNNYTNAQSSVALAQIDATKTLGSIAEQNQYNLQKDTLSHVKDVNGSQNRTAIILNATGNVPGSIAAEYGQTASSQSGDRLLGGLASTFTQALGALFAA